jgi:probable addiction module antidote protein
MKLAKTTVWDLAEYLETEEQITAYLDDIFKSDDPDLIVTAIGDVARACGMAKIAGGAGRDRESRSYPFLPCLNYISNFTFCKDIFYALGLNLSRYYGIRHFEGVSFCSHRWCQIFGECLVLLSCSTTLLKVADN